MATIHMNELSAYEFSTYSTEQSTSRCAYVGLYVVLTDSNDEHALIR